MAREDAVPLPTWACWMDDESDDGWPPPSAPPPPPPLPAVCSAGDPHVDSDWLAGLDT